MSYFALSGLEAPLRIQKRTLNNALSYLCNETCYAVPSSGHKYEI